MSLKKYLCIFFLLAGFVLIATHLMAFLYDVSGCRPATDKELFISACGEPFGDYEHGAYFLDLEKSAIASLKMADVLFLGSSRTQITFSTDSVRNYFSKNNFSYYLLGFGYFEEMLFPQSLIAKYGLNPKILIINADPFFIKYASPAASTLLMGDWFSIKKSYFQKIAQNLIPGLCESLPCKPAAQIIYRNSKNGEWNWWNTWRDPIAGHPLKSPPEKISQTQKVEIINNIKEFISQIKTPPECIILTFTPNDRLDLTATNIELAKLFGFQSVVPLISDVMMMDEDHFNLPTAERWSAAALEKMDPIFRRCISANRL